MKYEELLQTDRWHRLREYVYERDHGRCTICGAPGRDTHHWTYNLGIFCPAAVVLVCRPCHLIWQGNDPDHLPDIHPVKPQLMEIARLARSLGRGKYFPSSMFDFLGD